MAISELIIRISGENKELLDKLKEIEKESEALQSTLKGVTAIGAIGFTAFTGAILGSVAAFAQGEKSARQQAATLRATGFAAGLTSKNLQDMADELHNVTVFGDAAIRMGQNMLLAFTNIDKKAFKPALESAADLATFMGTDLASASQLVGKALNDPAIGLTALTRAGVQFSESQKKSILSMQEFGNLAGAQDAILQRLQSTLGGSAKAAAEGTGSFDQFKEVISQITEGIGKELAPAFILVSKKATEFAKSIRDNEQTLKSLASFLVQGAGFAALIAGIAGASLAFIKLNNLVTVFKQKYGEGISSVIGNINNFNQALIQSASKAVTTFIGSILQASGAALKFAFNIKENVRALLDFGTQAVAAAVTGFKNIGAAASTGADNVGKFFSSIGASALATLKATPAALASAGAAFKSMGSATASAAVSAKGFFSSIGSGALIAVKALPATLNSAGIALKGLNIGMRVAAIGAKLLSGALTLGLGIILPEIILFITEFVKEGIANFNRATKEITAAFKRLGDNLLAIGSGIGTFIKGLFTFDFAAVKAGAEQIKNAVTNAVDQAFKDVDVIKQKIKVEKEVEAKNESGATDPSQDPETLQAEEGRNRRNKIREDETKESVAEAKRRKEVLGEQAKVQQELTTLFQNKGSLEVIKIKEEELKLLKDLEAAKTNDEIIAAQSKLDRFREDSAKEIQEALAAEIEKRQAKKDLEAEFAELDLADRELATATELESLTAEELRRREVLRASAEEEAKLKRTAQAEFIKDQQKYGTAYATLNKFINTEAVKGTQEATGQLVQLQSSRSSTLKGIGKAAAVTQIGIDTAKSAMSIYSGFATIPIIGPALGVAGAIGAIAFGAEKISQVRAARQGGIVPGVGSGDIVPAFLEPGEIVVPRALAPTFQEEFSGLTADPNSPSRKSEVKINTIIGTEEFVKSNIIPAIRDAIQLDNSNIGVA